MTEDEVAIGPADNDPEADPLPIFLALEKSKKWPRVSACPERYYRSITFSTL
jgi:hypothetical protein